MSKNSQRSNYTQMKSWRDNELNFGKGKSKDKNKEKYLNNYGK
jgi:bisphosphoglycerate-dependent phosphoglycerate mutase